MRSSIVLAIVRKAGPSVTDTAICVSELYGRSTVIRSPPVNRPTPLFMSSWKCPAHISVSDLHVAMLQQDYDDGLLERKVKKVICRK